MSNKYRKFKNPKISSIFKKILVLLVLCGKSGSGHNAIFKEESIEILKNICLYDHINVKKFLVQVTLIESTEER